MTVAAASLKMWLSHPHFLLRISLCTGSRLTCSHCSLLLILFDHHHLRQLVMNAWIVCIVLFLSTTPIKPCCRVVACRPQTPTELGKHLVELLMLDKSKGRRQTNCAILEHKCVCIGLTTLSIKTHCYRSSDDNCDVHTEKRLVLTAHSLDALFFAASFERLIVFYLCFYYRMGFIHSRLMSIWQDQLPSSG